MTPDAARAALARHDPGAAAGPLTVLSDGFDSLAILAGDALWKFPRHAAAEAGLRREVALLARIAPRLTLAVPKPDLFEDPAASRHRVIPGGHLPGADYGRLSGRDRDALAEDLAVAMAELHALDPADLGAAPVGAWAAPEDIARRARPYLPDDLDGWADRALAAYAALPPDPLGEVFSHFDLHGWNMAFDAGAGRLAGIYDFGDAGTGPLHRDLVCPSLIATDLVDRMMPRYAALTGRGVDARRVRLLTAAHRLWELGDMGAAAKMRPFLLAGVRAAAEWCPV